MWTENKRLTKHVGYWRPVSFTRRWERLADQISLAYIGVRIGILHLCKAPL